MATFTIRSEPCLRKRMADLGVAKVAEKPSILNPEEIPQAVTIVDGEALCIECYCKYST